MLAASTFLPLVFNSLPPLVRSHHVWTTLWIFSLLIIYPKIFLNKAIVYLIIYGLFLFIAIETIWKSMDDWNSTTLFTEYYQIAIGVIVMKYFHQCKDYVGLAKLVRWSIVFLCITAIMTIISAAIDPMYARNIIGVSAVTEESKKAVILSFQKYGGGSYSTAAAFMCLFPILVYYYKNIELSLISKKLIVAFSIIVFYALLGMQIFGNIIIAAIFGIISILGMKKIKQSILVICLFFSIAVIIPRDVYVKSLFAIGDRFKKDSELNYKFRDLATFIETGANIEDNSTGTADRAERYPELFQTFIKSPFFGCFFHTDSTANGYNGEGAHLYWMNKITTTGIIGLILFLIIPFNFLKSSLSHLSLNYKFFYILASLSILCYGLMKAIVGRETWYSFFILLPGLYYLPLLKRNRNNLRGQQ